MTLTRSRMTAACNLALHHLHTATRLGAAGIALRLYQSRQYARLAGLVRLLRMGYRVELGANERMLVIEGVESPWTELDGE